jgi:hypothetical protein
MLVQLKDDHLSRAQEGVIVQLAWAVCPSFSPKPFLTGFRPFNTSDEQGMFSPAKEPVQMVKSVGPDWVFTQSNCTSISRAELDELFAKGKLHVEREAFALDVYLCVSATNLRARMTGPEIKVALARASETRPRLKSMLAKASETKRDRDPCPWCDVDLHGSGICWCGYGG